MLPQRLIPIECSDKFFHESWKRTRNLIDFPHPFRAVLLGPPGVGKTSTLKNLLMAAKPPYEEVICIHCDPDYSTEYDDLGEACVLLDKIPAPEEFEGRVKTMVILDDLEYKRMDRDQYRALSRLFGFVSTHKNISVCLTSQDYAEVPAICRRTCNLWVLWRATDTDEMNTLARRIGMKGESFKHIFDTLLPDFHDSLWVDLTRNTRCKLRKNGFIPIREVPPDKPKRKLRGN